MKFFQNIRILFIFFTLPLIHFVNGVYPLNIIDLTIVTSWEEFCLAIIFLTPQGWRRGLERCTTSDRLVID